MAAALGPRYTTTSSPSPQAVSQMSTQQASASGGARRTAGMFTLSSAMF
jgi:FlaG/FlaF family flagellin (archaellin)